MPLQIEVLSTILIIPSVIPSPLMFANEHKRFGRFMKLTYLNNYSAINGAAYQFLVSVMRGYITSIFLSRMVLIIPSFS